MPHPQTLLMLLVEQGEGRGKERRVCKYSLKEKATTFVRTLFHWWRLWDSKKKQRTGVPQLRRGTGRNRPWSLSSLTWALFHAYSQFSKQAQGMICIWLGPTYAYFIGILQSGFPFVRENSVYLDSRDPDTRFGKIIAFPVLLMNWQALGGGGKGLVIALMDFVWR